MERCRQFCAGQSAGAALASSQQLSVPSAARGPSRPPACRRLPSGAPASTATTALRASTSASPASPRTSPPTSTAGAPARRPRPRAAPSLPVSGVPREPRWRAGAAANVLPALCTCGRRQSREGLHGCRHAPASSQLWFPTNLAALHPGRCSLVSQLRPPRLPCLQVMATASSASRALPCARASAWCEGRGTQAPQPSACRCNSWLQAGKSLAAGRTSCCRPGREPPMAQPPDAMTLL